MNQLSNLNLPKHQVPALNHHLHRILGIQHQLEASIVGLDSSLAGPTGQLWLRSQGYLIAVHTDEILSRAATLTDVFKKIVAGALPRRLPIAKRLYPAQVLLNALGKLNLRAEIRASDQQLINWLNWNASINDPKSGELAHDSTSAWESVMYSLIAEEPIFLANERSIFVGESLRCSVQRIIAPVLGLAARWGVAAHHAVLRRHPTSIGCPVQLNAPAIPDRYLHW
ncbi:MAG: hypothetical protein ACT4QA_07990 [Panacagrimonas sp.]